MINVTTRGVLSSNTGDQNRDALVALYKTLNHNRGDVLYFPSGNYSMAPIHRGLFAASNETRYCSLKGDGWKSTYITNTDVTKPLFDYHDLDCFDQFFEDISFLGGSPCVLRLDSGGIHYRVEFHRVWFRNGMLDGLHISSGQYFTLHNVIATNNIGYGIRLSGPLVVNASGIDVEYNQAGGMLIEIDPGKYRRIPHIVINNLYSEGNGGPSVTIDGVDGVKIFDVFGDVCLKNGASGCVLFADGQFLSGASGNYMFGTATGEDRHLNYSGALNGGLPAELVTPAYTLLLYGTAPTNVVRKTFTVQSAKDYQLKWQAQCSLGGPGTQSVEVQHKDIANVWRWFDFCTRQWTTTPKTVLLTSDSAPRTFGVLFNTNDAAIDFSQGLFRVGITKPPLVDATLSIGTIDLSEVSL